jgi:hypothetical protein
VDDRGPTTYSVVFLIEAPDERLLAAAVRDAGRALDAAGGMTRATLMLPTDITLGLHSGEWSK